MSVDTSAAAGAGATVQVDRRRGFWFARLNRPQKRNAICADMLFELRQLLQRIAGDAEARALVLWGAGGHFCSGADLAQLLELLARPPPPAGDPIASHNRMFGAVLEELAALPVPAIAIVRGSAIGGGCGLAVACDRVIAADDAVFAMPEVTFGLIPSQIAPFLARRVGHLRARWLLAQGTSMRAESAVAAGLADLRVSVAALPSTLREALSGLARAAPSAIRATRALLERGADPPASLLDAAAADFAAHLRGADGQAGLAAIREKRAPDWHIELPELPEFS